MSVHDVQLNTKKLREYIASLRVGHVVKYCTSDIAPDFHDIGVIFNIEEKTSYDASKGRYLTKKYLSIIWQSDGEVSIWSARTLMRKMGYNELGVIYIKPLQGGRCDFTN